MINVLGLGISLVFLVISFSFFPFVFSLENENVTKQDIVEIQNKIDGLEHKLQENNQITNDKINDVLSSIDSLAEKFLMHDESLIQAFNVTWSISQIQLFTSIVSGAIVALMVMTISHVASDFKSKRTARNFLRHDFEDVNERVVILISNLRNTLQLIGPNGNIVDSMINRTMLPRIFMRRFLTGLLFFRWDVTTSKMSSLNEDQVEIISKLHGYVIKTDEIPELDIGLVSSTIQQILDSSDPELDQRHLISQALNIDLTTRLQHYDNVFHTIRRDLDPINWLNLSDEHFR